MNAKTMNKDNQFDELLHDALSEYREAEPLAGIESRILARFHASETGRKSPVLGWAVALACAAAVALVVWFGAARRAMQTAPSTVARTLPVEKFLVHSDERPVVDPISAAARPGSAARSSARISEAASGIVQSKPSVFPLPTPLTAEEHAFMAALQKNPDAAAASDAAMTIAAIEIKPLVIGGLPPLENPGEKQ